MKSSRRKALVALLGAHGFSCDEARELLAHEPAIPARDPGASVKLVDRQFAANFEGVRDVAPAGRLDPVQKEIARRVGKVSAKVSIDSLPTRHAPKRYGARP